MMKFLKIIGFFEYFEMLDKICQGSYCKIITFYKVIKSYVPLLSFVTRQRVKLN